MSRSRLTQVMNLLNLAPDIQEQILFLTWETAKQRGIHERSVRQLSSQLSWIKQRARWQVLISPRKSLKKLKFMLRNVAANGES